MNLQDLVSSLLAVLSTVLLVAAARTLFGYFRARIAGAADRPVGPDAEYGPVMPRAILTGPALGTALTDGVRPRGPAAPPAKALDGPEQRSQKRFRTCFLGTLHASAGAEADNLCDIVDLSASGARVRPVEPLPATDRIALGLRHFGILPARVIWRRNEEIGLEFESDPMETVTVMRGLLPSGPAGR